MNKKNQGLQIASIFTLIVSMIATGAIWMYLTDTQEKFIIFLYFIVAMILLGNKFSYYYKLAEKSMWREFIVIILSSVIVSVISYVINSRLPLVTLPVLNLAVLFREMTNNKLDKNYSIKACIALYFGFIVIVRLGLFLVISS